MDYMNNLCTKVIFSNLNLSIIVVDYKVIFLLWCQNRKLFLFSFPHAISYFPLSGTGGFFDFY